jgi:hypothetical protein
MGRITASMRSSLRARYPALPPHSRVYFANVPGGVALVTGRMDAPALRVWYRDTTLQGGFFSHYRLRAPGDTPGRDVFVATDSAYAWVDVVHGAEDLAHALRVDPQWEPNHVLLARSLVEAGDNDGGRAEFEKLAVALPDRFEYSFDVGKVFEMTGHPDSAATWYRRTAMIPGAPASAPELSRFIPHPR